MPRNEQDNSIEETNDWMDYLSNLNYDSGDSEETDGVVEEDFDTSLDDLMGMFNETQDNPMEVEEDESSYSTDDDFLNMFMNMEDDSATDYDDISNLLNSSTNSVEHEKTDNTPMDVGDVFSDALKVVSSLKDDMGEEEFLGLLTEEKQSVVPNQKTKKSSKRKNKKEKVNEEEKEAKKKSVAKEKKKVFVGGLKGIFSKNEKVDTTELPVEDDLFVEAPDITIEEEPKKKEQPKKKEKAKKAKKQKHKAKSKNANGKATEEENSENSKGNKKSKKTKVAAKKLKVKEEKKKKEITEVIEELEENEGKINRLAAALIIMIFSIMVVVVIAGTNLFSYTTSIKKATNYFDRQKYTQAYNEVYGLDIKDADVEIYDKIMTVMYVNKQLNSYNNFYSIGRYPEALDSLLKGLNRYDKYIELATVYGIKSDLDYVRGQILAELKKEYKISEKVAMKYIDQLDDKDYLAFVIDKSDSIVEKE